MYGSVLQSSVTIFYLTPWFHSSKSSVAFNFEARRWKTCSYCRCQDIHFFRRRWREGRSGCVLHWQKTNWSTIAIHKVQARIDLKLLKAYTPWTPNPSPPILSTHQLNSAGKVDGTEYCNASISRPPTRFLVLHFLLTGKGKAKNSGLNILCSTYRNLWETPMLARLLLKHPFVTHTLPHLQSTSIYKPYLPSG